MNLTVQALKLSQYAITSSRVDSAASPMSPDASELLRLLACESTSGEQDS